MTLKVEFFSVVVTDRARENMWQSVIGVLTISAVVLASTVSAGSDGECATLVLCRVFCPGSDH